jgi:hypothetical protein
MMTGKHSFVATFGGALYLLEDPHGMDSSAVKVRKDMLY